MELYYNRLSDNDYSQELPAPAVSDRLDRGELFALGRWYAGANVNLEIHPLVNAYITPIVNLHDGSGMLLPRVVYDFSDNIRFTLTALLNWGQLAPNTAGMFSRAPALPQHPLTLFQHGLSGILNLFLELQGVEPKR